MRVDFAEFACLNAFANQVFIGLGDGAQIKLGNASRLDRRAIADRAHQQAVQIREGVISVDDLADMQLKLFLRGHVFGDKRLKAMDDIAHVAVEQSEHQAILVAKIIFDQSAVEAGA